jgi:TIGR01777 family protein
VRILVAGASGMIGRALVRRLRAEGYFVDVLVRGRRAGAQGEYAWDPVAGTIEPFALAGADAVINLSGASISRIPWTRDYQRELVSSRILTTRLLAESMAAMDQPPPVFLSASAVGFYGDRPRVRLDDDSPKGDGFLSDLVLAWEQASALAPPATRVVNLRSAVVVARSGGMAPVRLLTQFLLGSRFGSGRQYWPWISLEDEVRAIIHLLTSELAGPVVLAGPVPATADDVTAAFARALGRPRWLPAPAWAIRLGLGEAGQHLLLDDAQVVPVRLEADGFAWRHPTIDDAVRAALGR